MSKGTVGICLLCETLRAVGLDFRSIGWRIASIVIYCLVHSLGECLSTISVWLGRMVKCVFGVYCAVDLLFGCVELCGWSTDLLCYCVVESLIGCVKSCG